MPETIKTCPTWWAKIYMSGPIQEAERILRSEFMRHERCATIEPTKFIYPGGEEVGFVIGLVNYPRFESTPEEITERAKGLAYVLLDNLCQHSVMVMTPSETWWLTKRD